MSAKVLVECVSLTELVILTSVLVIMARKHVISKFRALTAFVATRALYGGFTILLLFFHKAIGVKSVTAYNLYAYTYWPCFLLQSVLMVAVVYNVYSLALAPFEPLRKLGTIIFRWIAAITAMVTAGVAIGPHMFGQTYAVNLLGELQQMACVITLCLLLFVCFALRPLGLTSRSHAFGASLGLGVFATIELVQSAWVPTNTSLFSMMNFYSGVGFCMAIIVWGAYFALPEPKRQMVLLPTTSPYFFWNRISEALGDAPGFVAISGFTPESLAPGELHALVAAGEERPEPMRPVMQPVAVNMR